MADLILNEWLWSDLSGVNGTGNQQEAYGILVALVQGTDRLVVIRGSAFAQKCWRLSSTAKDVPQREAVKIFKSLLADPARCLLLDPTTLSDPSQELLKHCNPDDYYLIQAQQSVPDSTIVTTDNDLIAALQACDTPCQHRDPWVSEYLAATGIKIGRRPLAGT